MYLSKPGFIILFSTKSGIEKRVGRELIVGVVFQHISQIIRVLFHPNKTIKSRNNYLRHYAQKLFTVCSIVINLAPEKQKKKQDISM